MILPKMLQVGVFWTILNPPWSARRLDCKDYRHKRPKTCEGQSSTHPCAEGTAPSCWSTDLDFTFVVPKKDVFLICNCKPLIFGSKNSTCSTILGPSASPRMAEKLRSCGSLRCAAGCEERAAEQEWPAQGVRTAKAGGVQMELCKMVGIIRYYKIYAVLKKQF